MSTHYTNTTPMSQAMRDAEEENVVMRKGREYDRLIVAARVAVNGGDLFALEQMIHACEASLRIQAEEHARHCGITA